MSEEKQNKPREGWRQAVERDKGEDGVRKTLLTEFLCLLTHPKFHKDAKSTEKNRALALKP